MKKASSKRIWIASAVAAIGLFFFIALRSQSRGPVKTHDQDFRVLAVYYHPGTNRITIVTDENPLKQKLATVLKCIWIPRSALVKARLLQGDRSGARVLDDRKRHHFWVYYSGNFSPSVLKGVTGELLDSAGRSIELEKNAWTFNTRLKEHGRLFTLKDPSVDTNTTYTLRVKSSDGQYAFADIEIGALRSLRTKRTRRNE